MDASTALRRTVKIRNQRGLHARAAAKFVQAIEHLDCEVTVSRDDMDVSGRSIMGLMMLAAGPGSELALSATGREAAAALQAIADLVQRGFDED